MDIATATYAELKELRDQIEARLREIERQTFEAVSYTHLTLPTILRV